MGLNVSEGWGGHVGVRTFSGDQRPCWPLPGDAGTRACQDAAAQHGTPLPSDHFKGVTPVHIIADGEVRLLR